MPNNYTHTVQWSEAGCDYEASFSCYREAKEWCELILDCGLALPIVVPLHRTWITD